MALAVQPIASSHILDELLSLDTKVTSTQNEDWTILVPLSPKAWMPYYFFIFVIFGLLYISSVLYWSAGPVNNIEPCGLLPSFWDPTSGSSLGCLALALNSSAMDEEIFP